MQQLINYHIIHDTGVRCTFCGVIAIFLDQNDSRHFVGSYSLPLNLPHAAVDGHEFLRHSVEYVIESAVIHRHSSQDQASLARAYTTSFE